MHRHICLLLHVILLKKRQPLRGNKRRLKKSMADTEDNKNFWNNYARLYDFEINAFNGKAYSEMYKLISDSLTKSMDVLEVATGTGLIAIHIAEFAHRVEATDYSPKMIAAAKKKKVPDNVHFSIEDACALSFEDESFDAVIISNALHVLPNPERALSNIKRVLKPNGLLIAPTYAHGLARQKKWSLNHAVMRLIGFEVYSKWTPAEYVAFITNYGFTVENWQLLRAAFPLVYLTARNGKSII